MAIPSFLPAALPLSHCSFFYRLKRHIFLPPVSVLPRLIYQLVKPFCIRIPAMPRVQVLQKRLRLSVRLFIICRTIIKHLMRAVVIAAVYSTVFFWGGRETSASEALFLSLPSPLPLFQHWMIAAAVCTWDCFLWSHCGFGSVCCTRLIFFAGLCGEFLCWHARLVFCQPAGEGFCFSLLFSVLCFSLPGLLLLLRYWSLPLRGKPQAHSRKFAAVWQTKNLPVANINFAVYPVRNLPSASETLADGKRFICRRQTENLQSVSAPLAIGKIHV